MTPPDEPKIDLRALDPQADERRWELLCAAVVERAVAARQRRSVPSQLRAWARPTLAAAAALALVAWTGAFVAAPRTEATEPAYVLSQWAGGDAVPSATEILDVLGDDHGAR